MEAVAPCAADELMRVEALCAAATINRDGSPTTAILCAEEFLAWLLDEKPVPLPGALLRSGE